MAQIHLTTFIAAPAERVFDLSRSINLHKIASVSHEEAIGGTTSGLIGINETVTWQASHLLKNRRFKSAITEMQSPFMFTDKMLEGDFRSYRHEHYFKAIANGTIMIDLVNFETPYGIGGKLLNRFYLKLYLERLLQHRNNVIKDYAETTKWKSILI